MDWPTELSLKCESMDLAAVFSNIYVEVMAFVWMFPTDTGPQMAAIFIWHNSI
jgi:hypothetical protein